MNTWIKVARYHLVDRITYLVLPWSVLVFSCGVNLLIFVFVPAHGAHAHPGSLASIYVYFLFLGMWSMSRSLPFGLALGASRRSYYTGTVLLAVTLAALDGLALTVLQPVEGMTGGWGLSAHLFRVAYFLPGPWYLTWLTSFVGLVGLFMYGIWCGLVFRRWNMLGTVVFLAGQVTVLLAGVLLITGVHAWGSVGRFFTELTATGLTGLLAAVTAVMLAGGYGTIRRVTV